MAWKMQYRYVVYDAAAGIDVGDPRVSINADYSLPIGYNQALSGAASFVRRFQNAGIDVEAVVFGKPVGDDAAGTASPLPAGQQAEAQYAHLDTPGKGLMQRISAANTVPAGGVALDADVAPDLAVAA